MANTKNKSAAMALLKDLRRRHDQSIEDAAASIERAQAHLDKMEQRDIKMGEALDKLAKGLNRLQRP